MMRFLVNFFLIAICHQVLLVFCNPIARGNCSEPPEFINGYPSEDNKRGPTYPVGTTVYYTCDIGYGLDGDPRMHCIMSNGVPTWSAKKFVCNPISCQTPESPDNGRVVGSYYSMGMTISYECNPGYNMWSSDERQQLLTPPLQMCIADGQWVGDELPLCKPIVCPSPEPLLNGWYQIPSSYEYMSKVEFRCNHGYALVGDRERRCLHTAMWSGDEPECQKIDHLTTAPTLAKKENSQTLGPFQTVTQFEEIEEQKLGIFQTFLKKTTNFIENFWTKTKNFAAKMFGG